MKSLAVIHVVSMGSAYQLINGLKDESQISPLEVIPVADGSVCILEGEIESLWSLVRDQRSADLISVSIIHNCPEKVLKTFYAVHSDAVTGSMIIIEGSNTGKLFEFAAQAVDHQFGLVELKAPRAGQKQGVLILSQNTSSQGLTDSQESWIKRVKSNPTARVERINNLSPALRQFFEVIE